MPQDALSTTEVSYVELYQQAGTVQTIAASGTINTNYGSVRVTAAAAVASLVLQPGIKQGQICCIIHEGAAANTLTFAASGTSNVADGVSDVITGPSARLFVWDATTALWYKIG